MLTESLHDWVPFANSVLSTQHFVGMVSFSSSVITLKSVTYCRTYTVALLSMPWLLHTTQAESALQWVRGIG